MPLPDFDSIFPHLTWTRGQEPIQRVLPVRRIIGIAVGADEWTEAWQIDRKVVRDPRRRRYHLEKLADLLGERGRPAITQRSLLDHHFTRGLEVYQVGRVYFASNGLHRIAAAHLLGVEFVLVNVTPFRFRRDAPQRVHETVRGLEARSVA